MKRNTTQHGRPRGNDTPEPSTAQVMSELRRRAFDVKDGLLALSEAGYMAFVDAQAAREGIKLSKADRLEIRQILNGRVTTKRRTKLELAERALAFQSAA
jgi:hypothetical protein